MLALLHCMLWCKKCSLLFRGLLGHPHLLHVTLCAHSTCSDGAVPSLGSSDTERSQLWLTAPLLSAPKHPLSPAEQRQLCLSSSCEVWQCLQQCPALSVAVAVPCPFPIPAPSFLLRLLRHFLQLNHGQNGSLVASFPRQQLWFRGRFPIVSLPQHTAPHPHTVIAFCLPCPEAQTVQGNGEPGFAQGEGIPHSCSKRWAGGSEGGVDGELMGFAGCSSSW